MLNPKVQDAINEQINAELYSRSDEALKSETF